MTEEIPTYKFALTKELIENCKDTQFKPEDFLPTRTESKATGWDVRYAGKEQLTLYNGCYFRAPLGFRIFCPDGWWMSLKPRSSTFFKNNIHALYGTIDETFPQEAMFCGQYLKDEAQESYRFPDNFKFSVKIDFGDRIAQFIPKKRQEMNVEMVSDEDYDLLDAKRNAERKSGFGSSGAI